MTRRVAARQAYIATPPSEAPDALLLRMRALGMSPEHIARFLQVVGEVEASIRRGDGEGGKDWMQRLHLLLPAPSRKSLLCRLQPSA